MTTLVLDPQSSINEAISSAPEGPVTLVLQEGVWREKVVVNRPDVTLRKGHVSTTMIGMGQLGTVRYFPLVTAPPLL